MWQLHIEVSELFYQYLQPRTYEDTARKGAIAGLQRFFDRNGFQACIVRPFGSFAAGVYLPTADLDVVITTPSFERGDPPLFGKKKLRQTLQMIRNSGIAGGQVSDAHKGDWSLLKAADQLLAHWYL